MGMPATASLAVESSINVYDSFNFVPNQLISFYPKAIQKLLARKHKHNLQQQTTEKLATNIRFLKKDK